MTKFCVDCIAGPLSSCCGVVNSCIEYTKGGVEKKLFAPNRITYDKHSDWIPTQNYTPVIFEVDVQEQIALCQRRIDRENEENK